MNTLYPTVALLLLAILGFAAAHEMSYDDEERQARLYCELSQQGYWPRAAGTEFCYQEER